MENKEINFNHEIAIDEENKRLSIYRVFHSGEKQLYTYVDLPNKTIIQDRDGFREFACKLGENILIDSPIARKLLSL